MKFKTWFCKHAYKTVRWHWFHGFTSMEPARIEAELKCRLCGKTIFVYPKRGSKYEQFFLNIPEKQEW